MTYKGYKAKVEYSDDDDCLVGHVIGINHIISFHGSSVHEIRQAFKEAIDFYLHTEPAPEKPFSGRFNVRIPSEIHARAAQLAEVSGRSLNQFVHDAIIRTIDEIEREKTSTSVIPEQKEQEDFPVSVALTPTVVAGNFLTYIYSNSYVQQPPIHIERRLEKLRQTEEGKSETGTSENAMLLAPGESASTAEQGGGLNTFYPKQSQTRSSTSLRS